MSKTLTHEDLFVNWVQKSSLTIDTEYARNAKPVSSFAKSLREFRDYLYSISHLLRLTMFLIIIVGVQMCMDQQIISMVQAKSQILTAALSGLKGPLG